MSSLRWESSLITKVCSESAIKPVLKLGLEPEDFQSEDNRAVWVYILKHYRKSGVPSVQYIRSRFPSFEPASTADNYTDMVERIKEARLYADLKTVMSSVKDLAQREDAWKAFDELKAKVYDINIRKTHEGMVNATSLAKQIKKIYLNSKELKGMTGIPYPWAIVNEDTGGKQGGELLVFAGRAGTMKSWICVENAIVDHENGYKPLILTKELKPLTLAQRAVARFSRIDYRALRKGRLNPQQEQEFFDNLEAWAEAEPFHISYIKSVGTQALIDIKSMVEDVGPDCVYVDGAYFLGARDWAMMAEITTGLHEMAVEWDIPIMITNQLNQEHEKSKANYGKTTGGAYGDSAAQDADGFWKLEYTKEMRAMRELMVHNVKLREDQGHNFLIHAQPGVNMGQKSVVYDEWDRGGDQEELPPMEVAA